jgi:K+-dependent Na+/Ca+ exchanger-like protein
LSIMRQNEPGPGHPPARLRWTIIFCWKMLMIITIIGVSAYRQSHSLHHHGDEHDNCDDNKCIFRRSTSSSMESSSSPLIEARSLYPPEVLDNSEKRHGGFLLYVLCLFYMFCALAIVCDEFFVPALEVIIDKLQITEDVAGATLMAAGGSAPELFTSIIGVFFSKSDVGIGTIVGSAVFNVLFVIGMCAMFSKGVLELTWWPLFRDCSFYVVSICLLMTFFADEKIMWYEALILLMYYVSYVVFMKFNVQIEAWFKSKISNNQIKPNESDLSTASKSKEGGEDETERKKSSQWTELRKLKIIHRAGRPVKRMSTMSRETRLFNAVLQVQVPNKVDEEKSLSNNGSEDDDDDGFFDMSWPENDLKKQVLYVFLLGITGPLWLTLPDVRREGKDKYVAGCFVGSIMWIGAYSYIMVWMAEVIGNLLHIPVEIMGLTVLAAGTSVPDLITSVIVAKKGFGDMAVSSSIGSNIFDITIGLPFPWLLYSMINGAPITVQAEGLFCSIGLLLFMLVLVFISIAVCKWKMSKLLGFSMFVLYGVFVAMSLLLTDGTVISCPF